MLTRQVEGAHLKCGSYWADDRFGQLRLDPISVEGPTEDMERNVQQAGESWSARHLLCGHTDDAVGLVRCRRLQLGRDQRRNYVQV